MSAVIIGIEGTMLLAQEAAQLRRPFCAGVILFSRNYSSPAPAQAPLCHPSARSTQMPSSVLIRKAGRVQRFP